MDVNDFFGKNPKRPDHEDFWKLSEVLLRLDSGVDPKNKSNEENEAAWQARMAEVGVDVESVTYAATQRAFRIAEVETVADLMDPQKMRTVLMLSSIWLDAFAAGVLYERKE